MSQIRKFRYLRNRSKSKKAVRGNSPYTTHTNASTQSLGWSLFICSSTFALVCISLWRMWVKHTNIFDAIVDSIEPSLWVGFILECIYYALPILIVLFLTISYCRRPQRSVLQSFSLGQKYVSLCVIGFGLFYLLNHSYYSLIYFLKTNHTPLHWLSKHKFVTIWWHEAVIVLASGILLSPIFPLLFPKEIKPKKKRIKNFVQATITSRSSKFGIWLGRSTGILSHLWHVSGISSNQDIALGLEDAAQNIVVLGGIGSGKTTRAMQPLLLQLLDQDCGGLLFDVKGDVRNVVQSISKQTKKEIDLIGPGHNQFNLLGGLSPEIAASFLKSTFLLSGGSHIDGFWINTASELCRNSLGVLSFVPEYYSLHGLYAYLFDDIMRTKIDDKINPLLISLPAEELRILKSYLSYEESIFSSFDEKVKSGVIATVAQAISPFNHPELIDAFCNTSDSLHIEKILDGNVFLVDLPLARWGLGGKVAYTFIKLRFFNLMQNRSYKSNWNQDRPVFFMCDEYQELISANKDGLSDLNFWDKSRSSKTIGIISAQSVSSFYAALGDRDLAHAILQNFRQKICFRTEDQSTISMLENLVGHARVQRKTINHTTGNSSRALLEHDTYQTSESQSITEVREAVVDATLLRDLRQNEMLALLSINGKSMDDILICKPVYF